MRERISGQALGASIYQCRVCKGGEGLLQMSVQTDSKTSPYCRSFVVEVGRLQMQAELHALSTVFQSAEGITCGKCI